MRERLFPDGWAEGRDDRVAIAWDLSRILPVPKIEMACPVCTYPMALKDWKFHERTRSGSKAPHRCDVRLKCMGCGYVPIFGVPVSQPYFDRGSEEFGRGWITWRQGKAALAKAGFFDD